jgi:hypothetical protein
LRAELKEHIERIQGEFPGTVIALSRQLRCEGILINNKPSLPCAATISALSHSLASLKIATTDSNHGHNVYPNLLSGRQLTSINQAWVARHHLYSNRVGLCLFGRSVGPLLAQGDWLGDLPRIDAELCSGSGVTPLLKYSF